MSAYLEILKAGLTGLVLILGLWSYRLLHAAVERKATGPVLGAIRTYMIVSFATAAIAGGLDATHYILKKEPAIERSSCRDSLARLETQSRLPGVSVDDLRVGIGAHKNECAAILQDDR